MWLFVVLAVVVYAIAVTLVHADCDRRGGTFVQTSDNFACISTAPK